MFTIMTKTTVEDIPKSVRRANIVSFLDVLPQQELQIASRHREWLQAQHELELSSHLANPQIPFTQLMYENDLRDEADAFAAYMSTLREHRSTEAIENTYKFFWDTPPDEKAPTIKPKKLKTYGRPKQDKPSGPFPPPPPPPPSSAVA